MHYLFLFVIVVLLDLMPAFAPPAWIVAVFFRHKYGLAFLSVVFISASAATAGRVLLALATRKSKRYIPKKFLNNVEYAKNALRKNRQKSRIAIGLFLLSPLPSAQLFEAAGLLEAPLLPLAIAFFLGRLVTLSIYLGIAHITITSFGKLFESGFGSLWTVVFEIVCVLAIVLMLNVRQVLGVFRKVSKRISK